MTIELSEAMRSPLYYYTSPTTKEEADSRNAKAIIHVLSGVRKYLAEQHDQQVINTEFSQWIVECKGTLGCGPVTQAALEYLHQNGAQCINNIYGSGSIEKLYNNYVVGTPYQANLEQVCSNIFGASAVTYSSHDTL